jgi:hypothetical protein
MADKPISVVVDRSDGKATVTHEKIFFQYPEHPPLFDPQVRTHPNDSHGVSQRHQPVLPQSFVFRQFNHILFFYPNSPVVDHEPRDFWQKQFSEMSFEVVNITRVSLIRKICQMREKVIQFPGRVMC